MRRRLDHLARAAAEQDDNPDHQDHGSQIAPARQTLAVLPGAQGEQVPMNGVPPRASRRHTGPSSGPRQWNQSGGSPMRRSSAP